MLHGTRNRNPNQNVNIFTNKKGKAMNRLTTIVAMLVMAILTLGFTPNAAHAQGFDITQNFNIGLLKKAKTKAECTQYMLGALRACGSAFVDTSDKGFKGCKATVMSIYANCPSSGGGGGGGGGKKWCSYQQKLMPKGTPDADCKCPDGTDEVPLPNQRNKRKTGCKAKWIADKDCFVVKDGEQCPCPADKPVLDKEKWECQPCPADKPVWAELEDKTFGCVSCYDMDNTKPKWDPCTHKCEACPELSPYWDGSECTQCQKPKPVWNEKEGECEACPTDRPYWQPPRADGQCVSCKADEVWQPVSNRCVPTLVVKCPGSGTMVEDKKNCPPWNPADQAWGKAGKCPAGKEEIKTNDSSHPSRCVCRYGGECASWVGGGWPWWLWFLIGMAVGIFGTLGVQAGRRKWRERNFNR